MFKVGQKVVFVGLNPSSKDIPSNRPEINEIVTVSGIDDECYGFYYLMGYEVSDGMSDWLYDETELRPLDDSFAEEVLENIKQQIEEELITV